MQEETCAKMEEKGKRRRMSKKQKAEIVLALLRRESIEELSRNNIVAVHEVAQWRDSFELHREKFTLVHDQNFSKTDTTFHYNEN